MFKVSNREWCLIPVSIFDCIFLFLPLLILPFILPQKVNYYTPSLIHKCRLSSFFTGLMSSLETSAPLIILSKVFFSSVHDIFDILLQNHICTSTSCFITSPVIVTRHLEVSLQHSCIFLAQFYRKTHTFCCQERHTHIIEGSIFRDVMYNFRLSECVINGCQTLT